MVFPASDFSVPKTLFSRPLSRPLRRRRRRGGGGGVDGGRQYLPPQISRIPGSKKRSSCVQSGKNIEEAAAGGGDGREEVKPQGFTSLLLFCTKVNLISDPPGRFTASISKRSRRFYSYLTRLECCVRFLPPPPISDGKGAGRGSMEGGGCPDWNVD